jgi:YfiH family protein
MINFLSDQNFLEPDAKATHGFFGRQGGVSTGIYGSLNCGLGSQDSAVNVQKNRVLVTQALGTKPENLLTVHQIHSADCVFVDAPFSSDRPQADAMVTDVPGLALGILTADCGPILFYGEKADGKPIIGAAHAGWGGALKGILDSTVKTMVDHGAVIDTIRASIGPCIGPKSYEVQTDFAGAFLNDNPESEHFFKSARRDEHLMFDLPGYIAFRLSGCGVRPVSITGLDTYAMEDMFFSYRRTTHRNEKDYGRQISAIVVR